MTIYSGFSHWKRWFSLVMLVYQRVSTINFHKTIVNPVKLKWTLHQQSSHFFCEQGHHLDHSVGSSTMEGSCPALYKIGVKNLEKNVVYLSRCLNIPSISISYLVGIPTPLKKMMEWVTVGMMRFPINMESHSKVHGSSHHQPGTLPFLHHLAPKKNHRRFRIWIWYIMEIMRR